MIVNMSEAYDSAGRGAASVDHLRMVHGYELLVRTMRGDVRTHLEMCAEGTLLLTRCRC